MPKAADYDKLTTDEPGHEMPDTPKPASSNAGYARKRAIRDGRLVCHPRAEIERAEVKAKRAELLAARKGSPTRLEPEEVLVADALLGESVHSLEPDPDDTGDADYRLRHVDEDSAAE